MTAQKKEPEQHCGHECCNSSMRVMGRDITTDKDYVCVKQNCPHDTRQRKGMEGDPYSYHAPPTHPPLDQEWICLEEDLSSLTDYFVAALEGNESKSALRRMWHQETEIIRSRIRRNQNKLQGEKP